MIKAEKVNVNGKDWIKVSLTPVPEIVNRMKTVKGALYNPKSRLWAVPYEYRNDFEHKMGDFLILWNGIEGEEISAGGIKESDIPSEPIVPGYSVEYGEDGSIISCTGFKTAPWGEFQVKGFNVLVNRDFLILADDAGLGKSWQVSTAMEARKKLGAVKRGVVICKATLLYNWRDEIHKHTFEKAVVVAGTPQQRYATYSRLQNSDDWTFMIISYETFRVDVANLQLLDNHKPLDFVILDEAHKIKNPNSQIGAYIHLIPFKCKYILTATPLPNTPLEAYNYLKLGGLVGMNWWQFRNRYAIMGGFNNKEVVAYRNIRELRTLIQLNMLRRLKKDKLKELPDVVFRTIPITMEPRQQRLYNAVKQEILEDLKDTTLTRIPSALTKLLRLQQVVDSPALIGDTSGIKSSKLTTLDELLEELIDDGQNKVIVFSRFRTMVEHLQERYKKYNPAVIHGDVDANGVSERTALKRIRLEHPELPKEEQYKLLEQYMASERQKEVYKFQEDPDCKLFIGCTPACREGLTLTAATHVVFVDCEWSPAYVEQAFSRAHRIGQKNAVTVHYLVCTGTIDEYVQEVLNRKETMAQTMLDNGVKAVGEQKARELIATLIGEKLEEEAA